MQSDSKASKVLALNVVITTTQNPSLVSAGIAGNENNNKKSI
jgi:hypothetical protein